MCTRRPDETFEQYKTRRARENKETANRLLRCPKYVGCSIDAHKKYDISRSDYRQMFKEARKEYLEAKIQGFSDTEILDALYSGSGAQAVYAKFIENEIIGKV